MAGCENTALRIVLLGKPGSGKSATANTLLREKKFKSMIATKSVTKTCQTATRKWKGRDLDVVDTPGLFDPELNKNTVCREITRCVLYSCPGPHAVILVLQLGRYTEEEQKTVDLIKSFFGKAAMKHMIVLFTRKDELQEQSLDEFLKDANPKLNSIIQECGGRCMAFNNRAGEAEKEEQVQELVELIEKTVQENGGVYFSNDIYKDVEERVKQFQRDLENKYTDQVNDDIRRMKEETLNKIKEEEQKKLDELQREYNEKMRNIRSYAEEKVFTNTFKYIWDKISSFWKMLW